MAGSGTMKRFKVQGSRFKEREEERENCFRKNGFTLVEMLVSMGILVLVAVGVTNLFFSTIKGGKKTDDLVKLRQEGTYALNTIKAKVRNADSAVCEGLSLTIRDSSGNETVFVFDLVDENVLKMDSDNLAQDVFAGSFACPSPPPNKPAIVEVIFTIKLSTGEEQAFSDTISLRDY